jgi:thymidylate synthase
MIRSIIEKGVKKEDRTGVGTLSTFGNMMKF